MSFTDFGTAGRLGSMRSVNMRSLPRNNMSRFEQQVQQNLPQVQDVDQNGDEGMQQNLPGREQNVQGREQNGDQGQYIEENVEQYQQMNNQGQPEVLEENIEVPEPVLFVGANGNLGGSMVPPGVTRRPMSRARTPQRSEGPIISGMPYDEVPEQPEPFQRPGPLGLLGSGAVSGSVLGPAPAPNQAPSRRPLSQLRGSRGRLQEKMEPVVIPVGMMDVSGAEPEVVPSGLRVQPGPRVINKTPVLKSESERVVVGGISASMEYVGDFDYVPKESPLSETIVVEVPVLPPTPRREDELTSLPSELKSGCVKGMAKEVLKQLPPIHTAKGDNCMGVPSELRIDTIMEKLLHNGYVIKSRLYKNGKVKYLVACSRRGDKFIIKLDNKEYKLTFPQLSEDDCEFQKGDKVMSVPQQTKMSTMKCLDYDVCGAAFICNDDMCVTERQGDIENLHFSEKSYYAEGLKVKTLGEGLNVYPIVKLSSILEDPCAMESKIFKVSEQLHCQVYDKMTEQYEAAVNTVKDLEKKLKCLNGVVYKVDKELDRDICKLNEIYEKFAGQEYCNLCEEDKKIYTGVLKSLLKKKKLRCELLECISKLYTCVCELEYTSRKIERDMDPLLEELVCSLGVLEL